MGDHLPPLPEPSYAVNNVEKRYYTADQLVAFAEQAVKQEREAIADLVETARPFATEQVYKVEIGHIARRAIAAAIRARSEQGREG